MARTPTARRGALAALVLGCLLVGGGPAVAVDADDEYPTWAEVRAALNSEAASEAEYERLELALTRAQSEAATAAKNADAAAAAAQRADQDLQRATERESALQKGAKQAQDELTENSEALARMVSWLYVNGTGLSSASELIASQNPEDFMSKLSTATQISGTWNVLSENAAAELNNASALQEQADAAKHERERLAEEAAATAEAAVAARSEADAAVALALERSETMYEQLATLRGTTAEIERLYQVGQTVAADQAEQQRQRENAAQTSGSGGSGGSGGGSGQIVVNPAAAQAYARSRLGAHGWADSQFSCLVSLWNGESGWRADARNPYSGAYGIPQSYPAEKLAAAGADWRTNANTQIDWGLAYIKAAYGSPCVAWNTWQARNPHWY